MNEGVIPISWWGIALSLLPLALVGWIYHRHNRKGGLVIYATARMLGQLLLMGFVLVLILEIESPYMMIPVVNAFFAVGLVSLPGMMTGQIIAGIDPLLAIRYQIVVMAMIFGSAGLAVAIFLRWEKAPLQTSGPVG
jgi:ABC-type iron transport system FetAB permease component